MDDHDLNEQLRTFFRAVYAFLRQRLGPKVTVDHISGAARDVAAEAHIRAVGWTSATRVSVDDARTIENVGRGVRLLGHIRQMDDTTVVRVPREMPTDDTPPTYEDVETTSLVIEDSLGETLPTLGVLGRPLVEHLRLLRRKSALVEFLGVTALVPTGATHDRRGFHFQLVDVREAASTLDMIGASDEERRETDALRAKLKAMADSPLAHLTNAVVEGMNVVRADLTQLWELIEFTVLQAVSSGWVGHAPGHLHLLVVGPPGRGKKLVGLSGRILNPIAVELSPAKASAAGLIGTSFRTPNGWTSAAGAFPRAARGVVLLQDAHAWPDTIVQKLAPVMQEIIEDGVVRDSVAGGQLRSAPVSMIIDMNRARQVRRLVAREAALLGERPLLSRIDVVVEIPEDSAVPWEVAAELTQTIGSRSQSVLDQKWVRSARLLVAALRDAHTTVNIEGVRELLRTAVEGLAKENSEVIREMAEAGDVPVRLVISATRLVVASARAHDRSVATADDVARAMRFLNLKLSFLRLHRFPEVPPTATTPLKSDRQAWVAAKAAAQRVRPDDLAHEYTTETGEAVDGRTIRRDLRALGAHSVAKGTYMLPPPSNGPEE